MLAVFVAWTVAFSFGTALLAEPLGLETEASGEVAYIEGWVPWIAATLAWCGHRWSGSCWRSWHVPTAAAGWPGWRSRSMPARSSS